MDLSTLKIGEKIYALRTLESPTGQQAGKYTYRIYPVMFIVKEIRIGHAFPEDEETSWKYGPREISYICEHASGNYKIAFSPVGDELISKATVANRSVRGFLAKEDLRCEAEILKDCILRSYKHIGDVCIALD